MQWFAASRTIRADSGIEADKQTRYDIVRDKDITRYYYFRPAAVHSLQRCVYGPLNHSILDPNISIALSIPATICFRNWNAASATQRKEWLIKFPLKERLHVVVIIASSLLLILSERMPRHHKYSKRIECRHTSGKKKKILDFCSSCKSKFPTFARIVN